MSCTAALVRFLTCGFERFLSLSANSFCGVLGFFSNSFRGVLGCLADGFDSFFDFLPCFLRIMLDVLAVPSCPNTVSVPAVSKATIKLVVSMISSS
jgi:hypothetical protein